MKNLISNLIQMIQVQTDLKLSVKTIKRGSMKGFVCLQIIGKKEFDFNYIQALKDYLLLSKQTSGNKCIVNNYQLFINLK